MRIATIIKNITNILISFKLLDLINFFFWFSTIGLRCSSSTAAFWSFFPSSLVSWCFFLVLFLALALPLLALLAAGSCSILLIALISFHQHCDCVLDDDLQETRLPNWAFRFLIASYSILAFFSCSITLAFSTSLDMSASSITSLSRPNEFPLYASIAITNPNLDDNPSYFTMFYLLLEPKVVLFLCVYEWVTMYIKHVGIYSINVIWSFDIQSESYMHKVIAWLNTPCPFWFPLCMHADASSFNSYLVIKSFFQTKSSFGFNVIPFRLLHVVYLHKKKVKTKIRKFLLYKKSKVLN